MLLSILLASILFAASVFVTKYMIRVRIMDRFTHRSLHSNPTPRAGGVAIAGVYLIAVILLYAFKCNIFGGTKVQWLSVLTALIITAVISFYDDLRPIKYTFRLLSQIFCGLLVVANGMYIDTLWFPYFGYVSIGVWGKALTILWIVTITNIFNFMDGADGLVGGCSIIACVFLVIIANRCGSELIACNAVVLAIVTFGFLVFNFPKAKIFMGDIGSHFIGFTFAISEIILCKNYILIGQEDNVHFIPFFITSLLFGSFCFDVVFTSIRRLAKGKSIVQPHNDFLFHILLKQGWSHFKVSLLHFIFTLSQGGLLLISTSKFAQVLSLLVIIATQSMYAVYVFKYVDIKRSK